MNHQFPSRIGLHGRSALWLAAIGLVCTWLSGCAAITNPTANGIPVRILPDDLLAQPKGDLKPIPLSYLRQKQPDVYRLAAGDILGVYIEGVLGQADVPPPVTIPEGSDLPPSFGYPIPIRKDGRAPLPLIEPVLVDGLTLQEAEQAIAKAYGEKRILRPEDRRILVTLMRPRTIPVLVLREDSSQRQLSVQSQALRGLPTTATYIGGQAQGSGAVVQLAAYDNDIVHALAETGGLPGLEATDEVIIYRGFWDGSAGAPPVLGEHGMIASGARAETAQRTIHIPMRKRPYDPLPFDPRDAVLLANDIVVVRALTPQFYYTGGLLPSTQVAVPRDVDLTVTQAVLKAQGPLFNGAVNSNNLNGIIVQPGLGNPSPSLLAVLRQTPHGGRVTIRVDLARAVNDPREDILVQPGDILILQETPGEAFARYISQVFNISFVTKIIDSGSEQTTSTLKVP